MSGFHNRKAKDLQKPFPECVELMINIFELTAGMAGTKRLTGRTHRDVSLVRTKKPDVNKAIDPSGVYADDRNITSQMKKSSSTKKLGGTPMKMLISQEMSKETESKRKSPNVIARLMGLDDDLPAQEPVLSVSRRSSLENYPMTAIPGALGGFRQQEDGVFYKAMPCDLYRCHHEKMEFKEKQQSRATSIKNQTILRRRCMENHDEERMDLVRKKFMEAKRLATDEKLLQSREFQDALEVLSSNRDLFLKFLEEPNSLFSKQMKDLHVIPLTTQMRRITVLKPSKADTKNEILFRKHQYQMADDRGWEKNVRHWSSNFVHLKPESFSEPTRIVVLKPSTTKPQNMKAKVNLTSISHEVVEQNDLYEDFEDQEDLVSRHTAKEITFQMQESSTCHRRDESLLSSIYSNGYGGDESSFSMSDNEYIEEDGGSSSHSEIMTPTSRHSWDCINKFASPYSASSFIRGSYSPDSSMIREARKRLSERWALVAASESSQEMHLPRSSSTLGEMLSIPEVKKEECHDGHIVPSSRSSGGEDEMRSPISCLSIGWTKDTEGESSPRNLSRSKSVPASSTAYESIGLKVEGSNSDISDANGSKEVSKSKKGKSSFRGKISSIFFPRSKKTSREKPVSPEVVKSYGGVESGINKNDEPLKSVNTNITVEHPPVKCEGSVSADYPTSVADISKKATLSLEKPRACTNLSDKETIKSYESSNTNPDQPSPNSVLDAPFEDDNLAQSSDSNAGLHKALSRASPIVSVARTLPWDDNDLDASPPKLSKSCTTLHKANEDEQERYVFVQKLLSSAGLEKSDMVFIGWHSLDSPLDPMLLEKILECKGETKCREKRSRQRLLFDCVNSALLEIGWNALLNAYPWTGTTSGAQKDASAGAAAPVEVLALLRVWFSGKEVLVFGETDTSIVVDRALRREVGGKGWAESMRLEVDEITKEISCELLMDLVVEALADACM